jgi:RHS repeat-associated protein
METSRPSPYSSTSAVPFDPSNRWNGTGVKYDNNNSACGYGTNPVCGRGNLTDVQLDANDSYHAVFDAENRKTSITTVIGGTSQTVNYSYDGDGKRVQKIVGSSTVTYVYDAQGNLAAEYGSTPENVATQYLTADHLGSTRLVSTISTVNNVLVASAFSRSDYLPFGQEIPSTWNRSNYQADPSQRIKFTSKERDSETGLDFFEARYMTSAQGRFISPDPLLNSGRPWEPQSWNRYAYVLNNPIALTDPSGLYDFGPCKATKWECEAWRNRFNAGIADAQKALASGNLSKREGAQLKRVLDYLGSAGDSNGVTVSFGSIVGAATGEMTGRNSILLDMRKIDAEFIDPRVSHAGYDKTAEVGGTAIHEGTHALDLVSGTFDFLLRTGTKGEIDRTIQGFSASEHDAYGNEGLVYKGLNIRSIDGLWNPSWAEADRDRLREAAIKQGVERSVGPVRDAIRNATKKKQ